MTPRGLFLANEPVGVQAQPKTESSPRGGAILAWHALAAVLVQALWLAQQVVLPVYARKHLGAGELSTLVITAAPTSLFLCSIVWGALIDRLPHRLYAALYFLLAVVPTALMGYFSESLGAILALQITASIGGAGWTPFSGALLRGLYPPERRGAIWGTLSLCVLALGAAASVLMGERLQESSEAFAFLMPACASLQLVGLLIAARLWEKAVPGPPPSAHRRWRIGRLLWPIVHMRRTLRRDRVFFRYEAAYMTYGIGWMICTALLPLLATDKLRLGYDEFAKSTDASYKAAMILMTLPAGWLMDKLGPWKTCGLAFLGLTLYPLGLMWAHGTASLAGVSFVYGLSHAAVSVGWLLGPVSLAPSPRLVPRYAAIHATLVGLRGTIFQALGVTLYALTGSFTPPLLLAAAAFVWAGAQMLAASPRPAGRA